MIKGPITFDRMARWVLIAAAVVATIFVLSYLSHVLLPFFAALVFAYLLYPLVKFIQYRMKVKIRVLTFRTASYSARPQKSLTDTDTRENRLPLKEDCRQDRMTKTV